MAVWARVAARCGAGPPAAEQAGRCTAARRQAVSLAALTATHCRSLGRGGSATVPGGYLDTPPRGWTTPKTRHPQGGLDHTQDRAPQGGWTTLRHSRPAGGGDGEGAQLAQRVSKLEDERTQH